MTRETVYTGYALAIGAAGAAVVSLFGDWSNGMTILVACMALDYMSGIVVAGIFRKSPKTDSGGLNSNTGLKGIFKKLFTLCLVFVAHWVDSLTGTQYIRDAIVIALIVNEMLSIIENIALMGVPIPEILLKSIDVLHKKNSDEPDLENITWEEFLQLKDAFEAKGITFSDDGKITITNEGGEEHAED